VYFEQAPKQVCKKNFLVTNSSGVKTPQCIHHRGVLPTWCILPKNYFRSLKYSHSYLYYITDSLAKNNEESIRITKLGNFSNISNLQSIFRLTDPLKIVVCSFKSVIRLGVQNDSLVMNTPGSLNSPVVNTRGVLTPRGEYIGESWLPVVYFLVYDMACPDIILSFIVFWSYLCS
jgi:hypothetical protein